MNSDTVIVNELMAAMHHDSFLSLEIDCEGFILRYKNRRGVIKEEKNILFCVLLEEFGKIEDRYVKHIGEQIDWISVDDELPDADLTVLVKTGDETYLGFYDADGWSYVDGTRCIKTCTHWAEMPKGPE